MSKRKPTHPIRRLAEDCRGWSNPFLLQRKIARHVKPLLDALEYQPHIPAHGDYCLGCDVDLKRERLLAAWRAPLD